MDGQVFETKRCVVVSLSRTHQRLLTGCLGEHESVTKWGISVFGWHTSRP
jgi:AMMECR1 domain-containing protein